MVGLHGSAAGQQPKPEERSPTAGSKEASAAAAQSPDKPDSATLQNLKAQIQELKADYEKRIKGLEDQVEELQKQMLQTAAESAVEPAPQAASGPVQSIPGALNPAISVVGNFVGRIDDQKVYNSDLDRIDNKVNLREAEIDMGGWPRKPSVFHRIQTNPGSS